MSAELSHSPTDRPSLQDVVQTFRGITDVMFMSLTSRKATQTIRERRCRSQSSAEMTRIIFSKKSARFSSLSVCLQPVRRLDPHLRSRTPANGSGMLDHVQCRDSPPIHVFPVRAVAAPPRPLVREGLGRPWPVYDFGLEDRNIDQQLPARRGAGSSLMRHDTKLREYGCQLDIDWSASVRSDSPSFTMGVVPILPCPAAPSIELSKRTLSSDPNLLGRAADPRTSLGSTSMKRMIMSFVTCGRSNPTCIGRSHLASEVVAAWQIPPYHMRPSSDLQRQTH
jgi:hypothetical protein